MKRNERKDRNVKILPDGNKRKIQISKITPLLPSYIDVQYDEGDGYMEGAEEQEQYDKQEESTSQFNEYTGKGQEEEFFFYLTKEEAVRSQQLMKLLSSFSTAIKEGAIIALKAELEWALTVGEDTLRVVALENSMSGDKPIDGSNSQGQSAIPSFPFPLFQYIYLRFYENFHRCPIEAAIRMSIFLLIHILIKFYSQSLHSP